MREITMPVKYLQENLIITIGSPKEIKQKFWEKNLITSI